MFKLRTTENSSLSRFRKLWRRTFLVRRFEETTAQEVKDVPLSNQGKESLDFLVDVTEKEYNE